MRRKNKSQGFTLIEMIAVLVILGIVAAIGSSFVVSTIDSYNEVQERVKLIAKGRTVIEQMTRQLRQALPNAVRVSASGSCIEFMPLLGGANYTGLIPDTNNTVNATTSIPTLPFVLASGTPAHVIVAALSQDEVYSTGTPNSRVNAGTFSGSSPYSSIPLATSHRFERSSVSNRAYVAASPRRFCVTSSSVFRYSDYTFDTGTLGDGNPGGTSTLMAQNVVAGGTAFVISSGSEDRGMAVDISLLFVEGGNQVALSQQVLVRNVP